MVGLSEPFRAVSTLGRGSGSGHRLRSSLRILQIMPRKATEAWGFPEARVTWVLKECAKDTLLQLGAVPACAQTSLIVWSGATSSSSIAILAGQPAELVMLLASLLQI